MPIDFSPKAKLRTWVVNTFNFKNYLFRIVDQDFPNNSEEQIEKKLRVIEGKKHE